MKKAVALRRIAIAGSAIMLVTILLMILEVIGIIGNGRVIEVIPVTTCNKVVGEVYFSKTYLRGLVLGRTVVHYLVLANGEKLEEDSWAHERNPITNEICRTEYKPKNSK